jgi:hypothetical protein
MYTCRLSGMCGSRYNIQDSSSILSLYIIASPVYSYLQRRRPVASTNAIICCDSHPDDAGVTCTKTFSVCSALFKAENRIAVRRQDKRIGNNPHPPAHNSDDEIEDTPGITSCEKDGKP